MVFLYGSDCPVRAVLGQFTTPSLPWIFPLLGLVQIAPVTAAEFLGITRNLSDWLWGEGIETAVGEGCVGEPRAVRGVPVGSSPSIPGVLLLEGAIGGAGLGGASWGCQLSGPLDIITRPAKLLHGPKILCSGKSHPGPLLFSI